MGVEEDPPFLFLLLGVLEEVGVSWISFVVGFSEVVGSEFFILYSFGSPLSWVGESTSEPKGISITDAKSDSNFFGIVGSLRM